MIREHRAVIASRLGKYRIIDRDKVEDGTWPAPWITLDFPPPLREADRWGNQDQGRVVGWFQTACVGETEEQVGALHDAVTDLLLDWTPQISGWVVWPVVMDSNPRLMDWDDTVPDRRLRQVVTRWVWHCERAI